MDKPFTIKIQETEKQLIEVINKSELPAFCLKQILQILFKQLDDLDKKSIEEYQKKEGEKDGISKTNME